MSQLIGRYYEFSFSLPRAPRLRLHAAIRFRATDGTIHALFGDESLTVVVPDTARLGENVTAEELVKNWFEYAQVEWVAPYQTLIIDGPAIEAHVQRVRVAPADQRPTLLVSTESAA